ncbi:MAG: hypothetical protein OFPI_43090 [Osedax symbiont Rs2]|nr:MAG: hypothetical protein OFPI_43090 [Osedax symbiont Rs2]
MPVFSVDMYLCTSLELASGLFCICSLIKICRSYSAVIDCTAKKYSDLQVIPLCWD